MYLLAPELEEPERLFSRRVVVLAACGSALGGFFAGSALRDRTVPPDPTVDSGPEALSWALRVQEGPIDALIDMPSPFLLAVSHHDDERLTLGVERLVDAVVEDSPRPAGSRRALAEELVQIIERSTSCVALRDRLEELRRVR